MDSKIKKLILIASTLCLYLLLIGDLFIPGIFSEYFLVNVFFSWNCDYQDTFTGVFCQMFFVIKIAAIVFMTGILIFYLKKEV